MKSKEDIELALMIMQFADDHPALRRDECLANKAIIDFAKWVLDQPNNFEVHVMDASAVAQFKSLLKRDVPTDTHTE